jgi:hypothetical protein
MQKEVWSYRDDNKRIMKYQEEILQILNMLQKLVNKYSSTKQEAMKGNLKHIDPMIG